MRKALLSILLIITALILISCQAPNQLEPPQDQTNNSLGDNPEPIRPVINRTNPPMPPPEDPRIITPAPPPPNNNGSVFLSPSAQREFFIPIGSTLGEHHPVIGVEQLPLLRPAAIRTGDNHFRGYRQFIMFPKQAGNISFIYDDYEDPEYLGVALVFAEEEPFLNYSVILNSQRFYHNNLIGSDFLLLGREYRNMEANNFSLVLNGVDIEQYVVITQNNSFESNNQQIIGSLSTYDGSSFTTRLVASDTSQRDMILRAGETLRERLEQPNSLFGSFDMRFDGLEPLVADPITLRVFDQRVELEWLGPEGTIKVPLLGLNENQEHIIHGDKNTVHFRECASRTDGCVGEEDILIMQGNKGSEVITRLLRVNSINPDTRRINLQDLETRERLYVRYEYPSPNAQAFADVRFLDKNYRFYVVNNTIVDPNNSSQNISVANSLSVDLNANNQVRAETIPLFVQGLRISLNNILEEPINTSEGYVLNITIETPPYQAQRQDNKGFLNKEELFLQVVHDGSSFSAKIPQDPQETIWDQNMYQLREERDAHGLSLWGSQITVVDGVQETTRSIIVQVPLEQRLAKVTMGVLE